MPGITLVVSDRNKLWGDEGSGQVLSGGSCDGVRDGNFEVVSEELEESEFWYSLGEEGGSDIGFSDEMFEGNEYGKVEGRSLV